MFGSSLKLKTEPILWLGAAVIVLQTVIDYFDGGDFQAGSWWDKLVIVGGTLVARQVVTPTAKLSPEVKENL